jgi:hypothetical protein
LAKEAKMKIMSWYRNGSVEALKEFCDQNQNRPISANLVDSSEMVKGVLFDHRLESPDPGAGIFLLLNQEVVHPAYYDLEAIESLHSLDTVISMPWVRSDYLIQEYPLEATAPT